MEIENQNIFTDLSDIVDGTEGVIKQEIGNNEAPLAPKTDIEPDSLFSELGATSTEKTEEGSFGVNELLDKYGITEKPTNIDDAIAAIEAKVEAKYLSANNDEARDLNDLLTGDVDARIEAYVRSNAKAMLLESEQEILDKIEDILESDRDTDKYDKAITARIKDRLAKIQEETIAASEKRAADVVEVKKDFEEKLTAFKMTNHATGKEETLPLSVQQMIREYFWGEAFIGDIKNDPISFVLKTHPKLSALWEKNIEHRGRQTGIKQSIAGLEENEIKIGKGGGTITGGTIATASSAADIV